MPKAKQDVVVVDKDLTKMLGAELLKAYFTEDKLKGMAEELGPQIEKAIRESIIAGLDDEMIREAVWNSMHNEGGLSGIVRALLTDALQVRQAA